MSENLHNIDDLFKKALEENDEEPSPQIWDKLDRHLDKKNVVHINKKYRRVKWVAAASILFICAMGMYTFYNYQIDKEQVSILEGNNTTKAPLEKLEGNEGSRNNNSKIDTLKPTTITIDTNGYFII